MQGESARLGANLAAIGVLLAVVAAALAGLGAAWWAWMAYLLWGALWVTAALGMGDAASRKWLAGTLRRSTYTQIYTTLTRRLLTPLWSRYCDLAPDKAPWPTQFRAALTWRLYDRALLIAVAYPILLLVGQWIVTGGEGRVDSFIMLAGAPFWPERALVVMLLLMLAGKLIGPNLASASHRATRRQSENALDVIIIMGVFLTAVAVASIFWVPDIGAITVAVAGVGVFTGTVAMFFALKGALSVALAVVIVVGLTISDRGAGAFAVAVTVLGAGALAVAFAIEYFDDRGRQRATRALITFLVLVSIPMLSLTLDWSTVPEDRRTLFLFLAVFPLLNALFDVISYAATLSLTRRGLQSRLPILYGLADLALACVLFLGLGATLVAAIHGLNLLAGVPLLDLPALFDGVTSTPGAYFWLYAMLFSTILPTALHAALSLLGLQGIWPKAPRGRVALWVESADASTLHTFRASLALGVVWTVPLLLLAAIIWALWALSAPAILWLLSRYLDALIWIATHPIGAM